MSLRRTHSTNPFQPRKFVSTTTKSLSGREHPQSRCGVNPPSSSARPASISSLIAVERRLRALRNWIYPTFRSTISDFNDQEVLEAALVRNLQRSGPNAIEKAHTLQGNTLEPLQFHPGTIGHPTTARMTAARDTLVNLRISPSECRTRGASGTESVSDTPRILKG